MLDNVDGFGIGLRETVFGHIGHADAQAQPVPLQQVLIKNGLIHDDILGDIDLIGDVVGMLEQAGDGKHGLGQQRRIAGAGLVLQADRVPDLKPGLFGKQVFNHAFLPVLRGVAADDLRNGNALGHGDDGDADDTGVGGEPGDGFIAALDLRHTVNGADGLGIVPGHEQGRIDHEVLHVEAVIVAGDVDIHRAGGKGNTEIDRHGQHGNHDDRDKGGQLVLDIAVCFQLLRLFHEVYQTRSVALAGSRFSLTLPTRPLLSLTTRLAILAISGLWVIMTTVVPRLFTISSKTERTSMLV